jgi:hypothetical protein
MVDIDPLDPAVKPGRTSSANAVGSDGKRTPPAKRTIV